MSVHLFRDGDQPVFFHFTGSPTPPMQVEIGGQWHPMTLEGRIGTLLVCGPEGTPPGDGVGYIRILEDCVPRVRDSRGEIWTDGWIRLRDGEPT